MVIADCVAVLRTISRLRGLETLGSDGCGILRISLCGEITQSPLPHLHSIALDVFGESKAMRGTLLRTGSGGEWKAMFLMRFSCPWIAFSGDQSALIEISIVDLRRTCRCEATLVYTAGCR